MGSSGWSPFEKREEASAQGLEEALDRFTGSLQMLLHIFDLPFAVRSQTAMVTIIFLTLFPSLSAFVIQLLAQRIASPLRVSLIFALEPVFAAVFAWTLGGETFVMRRGAGGLLIACALMLSGLPTPRWLQRKTDA